MFCRLHSVPCSPGKRGALLNEWIVDAQTSNSALGPAAVDPLLIMTVGMVMLAVQIAFQIGQRSVVALAITVAVVAVFLAWHNGYLPWKPSVTPPFKDVSRAGIGIGYGIATLLVMFSGMPIAFALGAVALCSCAVHAARVARYHRAERLRGNGQHHAARDPAFHPERRGDRPVERRQGSLLGACTPGCIAYPAASASPMTFACALFAAMAGSSAGDLLGDRQSAGIPEMRDRGYSPGFAAGIIAAGGTLGILLPPSITMILYAVAAEKSRSGRLFLAGIGPGLLLVAMFAAYSMYRFRREYAALRPQVDAGGARRAILTRTTTRCARSSR